MSASTYQALGVPPHVQQYLESCTKAQRDQLAASLQGSHEHRTMSALEAASNAKAQPKKKDNLKKGKETQKTNDGKNPRKPSDVTGPQDDKAKRPLNAWMAFRAYYSPLFTSVQQKQISGFLSTMWQNDPFQAKWSIVAKAYSMLRDLFGKERIPLDVFLAYACPLVKIIQPSQYLKMLGWEITVNDGEKSIVRRFTPDVSTFPESYRSTHLSVDDIATKVYGVMYPTHTTVKNIPTDPELLMAVHPSDHSRAHVAVQPAPPTQANQQGHVAQQLPQVMTVAPAGQAAHNLPQAVTHGAGSLNVQPSTNNAQVNNMTVPPNAAVITLGMLGHTNNTGQRRTCKFNNPQAENCIMTSFSLANPNLLDISVTSTGSQIPIYPFAAIGNSPHANGVVDSNNESNTYKTADNNAATASDGGTGILTEGYDDAQDALLECAKNLWESEDQYPYNRQFNPDDIGADLDFNPLGLGEYTAIDMDSIKFEEEYKWLFELDGQKQNE